MKLRARLFLTGLLAATPMVLATSWFLARQAREATVERVVATAMERMESGYLERLLEDPTRFPPLREVRGGDPRGSGPPGPGRGPGPGRFGDGYPRGRGEPDGRRSGAGLRPGEGPYSGEGPRLRDFREQRDGRQGGSPGRPGGGGSAALDIFAYGADFQSQNPHLPGIPSELLESLQAGEERAYRETQLDGSPALQVALRTEWSDGPGAYLLVTRRSLESLPQAEDYLLGGLLVGGLVLLVSVLAAGPMVVRLQRLTRSIEHQAKQDPSQAIDGEYLKGSDEIADLAKALDGSRSSLRGALTEVAEREQSLRRFVENTTHDVAIPLTVLQGHLAAMAQGSLEDSALTGAVEEAHYVAAILRNLGTVARLEAGEAALERGPVNMVDLVERCVARHRPIAAQSDIHLDYSVPESSVVMEGNVTLLEEAVSNLIHNSLRYNTAGGHVAVVLGESLEAGFWLRVADDGPGIDPDALDALTQRAGRSEEARSRHPDGRGLGLNIVLDVAARHSLAVRFETGAEGGLEVTLQPKPS